MLIVIPILGFGRTGGYRVISELASRWTDLGHDVQILVHQASPPPYFPTRSAIRWVDDWGRPAEGSNEERFKKRRGASHVLSNLSALYFALQRCARGVDILLANHSLTAWPVWACRTRA